MPFISRDFKHVLIDNAPPIHTEQSSVREASLASSSEPTPKPQTYQLTEKQIRRYYSRCIAAGYGKDEMKNWIVRKYGKIPEELSYSDYDYICGWLNNPENHKKTPIQQFVARAIPKGVPEPAPAH